MLDKQYKPYSLSNFLLKECADELEALIAEETGEGPIIEKIRKHIEETFGFREIKMQTIVLDRYLPNRLETLKSQYGHRHLDIHMDIKYGPKISLTEEVLNKVFDGLVRNAIEATPDEGRIEMSVGPKGKGMELTVRDFGVGIIAENQNCIFEGFFSTQETMLYSSKRPFDFNAGGKGADLLRMKIFCRALSFQNYHAIIALPVFIPRDIDFCPGKISRCRFCNEIKDCLQSGEITFRVVFLSESEFGFDDDQQNVIPHFE
jgi:hypothetical protein